MWLGAVLLVLLAIAPAEAARKRPDLTVRPLSITGPLVPGGPLSVSVTVRNAGRARAKASRTSFVLSRDKRRSSDDLRLGTRRTKAIKARKKKSRTIQFTVPALLPAGTWRVIACADSRNKLRESNERKNCRASGVLTVVAPPLGPPVIGPPPPGETPPVVDPRRRRRRRPRRRLRRPRTPTRSPSRH